MAQVEALTGQKVECEIEAACQIDAHQPQVTALADECDLSPAEWQTLPILVNPPARVCALSLAAARRATR